MVRRKMVKVKICGLTNREDAQKACEYGADLVGFLFAPESPRCISPDKAKDIIETLPDEVGKTGLFRDQDPEEVARYVLLCGLNYVQLHGDESPEYCRMLKESAESQGTKIKIIKTFKVKDKIIGISPVGYDAVDHYLFDTYHPEMMGGTGTRFDWNVLKGIEKDKSFFVAGGLDPDNVAEAIQMLRPYGVDVASGVERSVGKKDWDKIKEFILNAKNA